MKVATILVLAALIAAVPASGLYAAISWSDLDAYWKLDGDLTDSAGSHDGTYTSGTPVYATGFDGTANGALDFAGTAEYVATTFTPGTGAKSLSLFFSTNSSGNLQCLAGSFGYQRFYAGVHGNNSGPGSISPGIGDGAVKPYTAESEPLPSVDFTPTGTDVSTDNAYHHLVLITEGANYVDVEIYYRSPSDSGHLYYAVQFGGTSGGAGTFNIGQLVIDGTPLGPEYAATGLVDDVAVFNRMLTQAEVESIYAAGSVEASMSGLPPLPGDANLDNIVNDQDASILAAHWQQTGMGWGDGDFNDDQVVNDQDASILAANWQETQEGAAPVPEPSTVVGLLALGLAALVAITRRRV